MLGQDQDIPVTSSKCLLECVAHHIPNPKNVPVHQTFQNICPAKEYGDYHVKSNIYLNIMFKLSTSILK